MAVAERSRTAVSSAHGLTWRRARRSQKAPAGTISTPVRGGPLMTKRRSRTLAGVDPVDPAGRGAGDDGDAGRGAAAPVRGRAHLPGALGAALLRRPPRGDVRADPPVRALLQHAAPGRPDRPDRHQARRRPGRELDHLQGRPHLHVQAPPGRQVPRRGRDDVRGRQGVLRQDHLPAGGRRIEPEGPVPRRWKWWRRRIPPPCASASSGRRARSCSPSRRPTTSSTRRTSSRRTCTGTRRTSWGRDPSSSSST